MSKLRKAWALVMILCVGPAWTHAGMAEAQKIYKEAQAQYAAKNYANALELFFQVIDEEPSYADYLQARIGHCYYAMGDEGKALYHYEQHLEFRPDDKTVLKYRDYLVDKGALPDSSATGRTLEGFKVRSNHIYINPGALATGSFSLGYERAITNHNTLLLDGVYGASGSSTSYGSSTTQTTYGGGIGWHFTSKRLGGLFAGPKVTYEVGTIVDTYEAYDYSINQYVDVRDEYRLARTSIGAEAGYQWVYASGFVYAVGFGVFHHSYELTGSSNYSYYGYGVGYGLVAEGVQSNLLMTLGFAF